MTYSSYEIWFEEGDAYDVAHRKLDLKDPVTGARLNTALRNFEEDPRSGLLVRGHLQRDICLVPDGSWPKVAAVAEVDHGTRQIRLIALLSVTEGLPIRELEAWAERHLGI